MRERRLNHQTRLTVRDRRPARLCPGAAVLLALLVAFGCAIGAPRVRVMESAGDGIAGPASAGRVGDFLLENRLIRVVVSAVEHPLGSATSGGRIIDAAPVGGADFWGQSILMLTDDYPRQARYLEAELIPPGEGGGRIGVRLTGEDNRVDDIEIVTEYLIGPSEPFVTVRTTYSWTLRRTLENVVTGDRIEAGCTAPFLGYHGFLGPGEPEGTDSTVAADVLILVGDDVSYGWYSSRGAGVTPYVDGGLRFRMRPFHVPGRGKKVFERRLYIAAGGPAAVLAFVDPGTVVPVRGRVTGNEWDGPVAGALVEILDPIGLYTVAYTGDDGTFRASLPPGDAWRAHAYIPGGKEGRTRRFRVSPGEVAEPELTVDEPGTVHAVLAGDDGSPLPGRVTVLDRRGNRLRKERGRPEPPEAFFTESGELLMPLPAGDYRLFASHGIEYSIDDRMVEVRPGETTEVRFDLRREVDRGGMVAADLDIRTVASLDGEGVTVRHRMTESIAEGLGCIVIADRGRVPDTGALPRLAGKLVVVPGEEVVLRDLGRFGVFPLSLSREIAPRGGHGAEGKAPSELFSLFRSKGENLLIQVHVPREPGFGYLQSMGVDPVTGLTTNIEFDARFDLLEVANGRELERAPEALGDWFHLLNLGNRIFATGNSGSRTTGRGGPGVPRNYIDTGSAGAVDMDRIVERLREGRSFLTTGPMIEFRVNRDARPGDLVKDPDGVVDLVVRADAAGWIGLDHVKIFGNGAVVAEKRLGGGSGPYEVREMAAIYRDTWFVAVVTGGKDLSPVYTGPDGEPVYPVAVSNPVWVDFNGNGLFDAPGVR